MEHFVRSVLAGVAVGVFTAAVVNLFVLDKLAIINTLAIETIKMRQQEVGMSTLEPTRIRRYISKKQEVDEMWESIRKMCIPVKQGIKKME